MSASRIVLARQSVLVLCPDERDDVWHRGVALDHAFVRVGGDDGVPEFVEDVDLVAEPYCFSGIGLWIAVCLGEVPPAVREDGSMRMRFWNAARLTSYQGRLV